MPVKMLTCLEVSKQFLPLSTASSWQAACAATISAFSLVEKMPVKRLNQWRLKINKNCMCILCA